MSGAAYPLAKPLISDRNRVLRHMLRKTDNKLGMDKVSVLSPSTTFYTARRG